ncbi:MAG: transposase, partial [Dehalococcoidia bacterium]|nr:transposase [Dehalococcoidia bacterium]
SFHRSAVVRQVVEAAGCRLVYLPRYSPDLNPIEQVWSWLKRWVNHAWSLTKRNLRSLVDEAVCLLCQPLSA